MANSNQTSTLDLSEFAPASYEAWRKEAEATLDGAPFDKKLVTKTPEGIDIQPIYTKDDLVNVEPASDAGVPPFRRGIRPSNDWEVGQKISAESVEAFNAALRHDLNRGQNAVVLSLSCGCESAVPVKTAADLGRALDGVDLTAVPLYLEAGSKGLPFFSLLVSHLEQTGANLTAVKGGISQDPLGDLAVKGSLPVSLDQAYAQMALTTRWAAAKMPGFATIGVNVAPYHEAGATAVQEVAIALATGVEYLREMEDRGIAISQAASRIRFTFAVGADFFMAIAKFRAARELWAKVVAACGGSAEAQKMQIHATTCLYSKSKLDPYVNMLRATTEAVAAVVGGCQVLNVGPFDEVIRPADEFSRRIARNTQLILSEECKFDHVADPAGGSYYVEALTEQIARKAWERFQEAERLGGMAKALEAGLPQKNISAVAAKRDEAVALRRNSLVGVNVYANATEKPLPGAPVSKAENCSNDAGTIAALDEISKALDNAPETLVTLCVEAAKAAATVCQIRKALAAGDSVSVRVEPLKIYRAAEGFENLRAAAVAAGSPKVFLANMGPLRQFKARADFSTGFFQAGAFEVVDKGGYKTVADAASAATASGAPVVVICSTDDTYPEIVPDLVAQLKAANPKQQVILAGYPKDHVEAFKQAGVDDFIHIRANCLEMLKGILAKITGN